jgi:hypothetical protein
VAGPRAAFNFSGHSIDIRLLFSYTLNNCTANFFAFSDEFSKERACVHKTNTGTDIEGRRRIGVGFEEGRRCADCEQWQEMIYNANQKLAELRQPTGLLGIQDSVRHSFSAVEDALTSPETYAQRHVREEELVVDIKTLTLVLLEHQRKEHSPVAQDDC